MGPLIVCVFQKGDNLVLVAHTRKEKYVVWSKQIASSFLSFKGKNPLEWKHLYQ